MCMNSYVYVEKAIVIALEASQTIGMVWRFHFHDSMRI